MRFDATNTDAPEVRPVDRPLSPLLAIAIISCWPLFVWFLLRKGYAPSTRRAAFTYAGANLAVALVGVVFGW